MIGAGRSPIEPNRPTNSKGLNGFAGSPFRPILSGTPAPSFHARPPSGFFWGGHRSCHRLRVAASPANQNALPMSPRFSPPRFHPRFHPPFSPPFSLGPKML